MQSLHGFFTALNDLVWGVPMIVLILGTGLYLQIRLGFMPIFKIGFGFRMIWQSRRPGSRAEGEISPFAALMTALSATVGTGNIGFLHRTALVRLGDCILHGLGKFLYLDFHKIVLHYVFD